MGIGYFPQIYPDELVYSVLARFYVHSGYVSYNSCFNEIYLSGSIRPDIEFVNQIVPEIRQQFERQIPWEQVIWKHTMYPYYSRFADKDKREEAWLAMEHMGTAESIVQPKFSRILSLPQSREEKHCLKYCPICAKRDRNLYGETYWHRRHQVRGLDICYEHGCRLTDSDISLMSYGGSSVLRCAEHEIGQTGNEEVECLAHLKAFATYVVEVLEQGSYREYSEVTGMLYSKAKYIYTYGRQKTINIVRLNADFQEWKQNNKLHSGLLETWQIKKLLSGYRRKGVEVCQMAWFFKTRAEEMANPVIEDTNDAVGIDDKIAMSIDKGKQLKAIAKELKISLSTVQAVCNEKDIHTENGRRNIDKMKHKIEQERLYWLRLKKKYPDMSYNALCQMGGHRRHLNFLRKHDKAWTDEHWFQGYRKKGAMRDWSQLDEETLLKVRDTIKAMLEDKPQAICLYSVAKRIGIASMTISTHLPKCENEIRKYMIPQEELYARKLLWAFQKIQDEDRVLNWKQIVNLSNVRKDNALACLPYLKAMAEPEVYEQIRAVL